MNINQFKLGLRELESHDWALFEELCNAFLSFEFSDLRPMASPAGDKGRDAQLFNSESISSVVFQYSVQKDFNSKIRDTVLRINSTLPDVKILIYVTNQEIGARGDSIKQWCVKEGIVLDIRDYHWFVQNSLNYDRSAAALNLIDAKVTPLLKSEDLIRTGTSALSGIESQAALVYLGLQWENDIRQKGLSKLSFDALVRAALRRTNQDNRMKRDEIHEFVLKLTPNSPKETVILYIDNALKRLSKRYIRHHQLDDTFCLTFEEHERISEALSEREINREQFIYDINLSAEVFLIENKIHVNLDNIQLSQRIPRILERILLARGEVFVHTVLTGNISNIQNSDIRDVVIQDINMFPISESFSPHIVNLIIFVIRSVLSRPNPGTADYLNQLANSYTLFSFLNETTEIQSVTKKLFNQGKIWLDTSVLLPLVAERFIDDPNSQRLTKIFTLCNEVGIEFLVTPGVIQEVNAHINKSIHCNKYPRGQWQGKIPYIYFQYLASGQNPENFLDWCYDIKGLSRPEEDIELFLQEEYSIKTQGLNNLIDDVDHEVRLEVERLWTLAHTARRRNQLQEEDVTDILIEHDVESFLGIIGIRLHEDKDELGYKSWLLTFDRVAWSIRGELTKEFGLSSSLYSPLLSISFLVNNLSFGPLRANMIKNKELSLPLILDVEMSENMPISIIAIAERVRFENYNKPEYVIRRKVRDAVDRARSTWVESEYDLDLGID